MRRRPFLAPETLQISTMDCGVAAVSCMLVGFGIDANYEKLRELCQTEVDGTSIDALEDLCQNLGLDVCQHLVPADLILEATRERMPLIAVQEPFAGRLHFVVLWNRARGLLQVMDPRGGRSWTDAKSFSSLLVRHQQQFDREEWEGWFPTSSFREALAYSANELLASETVRDVSTPILESADPAGVSNLDAALRLVRRTSSVSARSRGWRDDLFRRALQTGMADFKNGLPPSLRAVVFDPGEGVVEVRCAVLLGVTTPQEFREEGKTPEPEQPSIDLGTREDVSLFRNIFDALGTEVVPFVPWVVVATVAIAIASAIELLVYRAAVDLPALVTVPQTRIGAGVALVALLFILLALEAALAFGVNRLGRLLEMRLRMKTMWAIPRVDDHFVRSRPTSDLAYRAQALAIGARLLPSISTAASAVVDLGVTLLAIGILDFRYAVIVTAASGLFVFAWMGARGRLREVDARLQVHASRLINLLLDTLRGIRPVRLHGFQDAFRDDQLREIEQWRVSAEAQIRVTSSLQASYTALSVLTLAATFCTFHYLRGDPRQFVVLAFWSFRIPPIMTRLAQFAQVYPLERNAVERLLEVTKYVPAVADEEWTSDEPRGVGIQIRDVSLVLGGHAVLDGINLEIPAGQHVAIVGASGSGKSSIVSLLLGIHEPTTGEVRMDGVVLDRASRQTFRAVTMWIDPAIQLWNKALGANLEYAARGYTRRPALEVLEASDLLPVLASLEKGLEAELGAEGAFVSGGEGQRVRVGRGLLRASTRLALLDEAFRGLDRATRQRILLAVRRLAIRSTMVFVSHDISHAMSFERVLVVDGGRIIEDGAPQELASEDTAFARLLNAEKQLLESAWSGRNWRRLRVEGGQITEVDNRA